MSRILRKRGLRTTRHCLLLYIFLVVSPAFAQTTTLATMGLEPPELNGAPKKTIKASNADTELFEIIRHLKSEDETKSTLPKLDDFIVKYPDYSDALFLRATCKACILNSRNFASMKTDVQGAMSCNAQVYDKKDYYSLQGKIELANANYVKAVDYQSMVSGVHHRFNTGGERSLQKLSLDSTFR